MVTFVCCLLMIGVAFLGLCIVDVRFTPQEKFKATILAGVGLVSITICLVQVYSQ